MIDLYKICDNLWPRDKVDAQVSRVSLTPLCAVVVNMIVINKKGRVLNKRLGVKFSNQNTLLLRVLRMVGRLVGLLVGWMVCQ